INMSFSIFILCLDWLYLIDVAKINSKGKIILCS
ncbi:ABC-three component system middle component 6, partial [Flavobacterium psychrophilum]